MNAKVTDANIRAKGTAVMNAFSTVVLHERHVGQYAGSHGITIYGPAAKNQKIDDAYYRTLDLPCTRAGTSSWPPSCPDPNRTPVVEEGRQAHHARPLSSLGFVTGASAPSSTSDHAGRGVPSGPSRDLASSEAVAGHFTGFRDSAWAPCGRAVGGGRSPLGGPVPRRLLTHRRRPVRRGAQVGPHEVPKLGTEGAEPKMPEYPAHQVRQVLGHHAVSSEAVAGHLTGFRDRR